MEQSFSTNPSLRKAKVVFTSSPKRCWLTFPWCVHRSQGGGWTEDLLIADWEELEKNVASEVHIKRSNLEKYKSTPAEDLFSNIPRCRRIDQTSATSYLVFTALNHFSKKIRIWNRARRSKTPSTPPQCGRRLCRRSVIAGDSPSSRTQNQRVRERLLEHSRRFHLPSSRCMYGQLYVPSVNSRLPEHIDVKTILEIMEQRLAAQFCRNVG